MGARSFNSIHDTIRNVTERPPRPPRREPREIIELRELKLAQPDLSAAADMQIALVDLQRRVQGRVPLPRIHAEPDWLTRQQQAGRPVVRFEDIPIDWTDFRLTLRQTADVLRRFDTLDPAEHEQILALARDGNALEPLVTKWYTDSSGVDGRADVEDAGIPSLGQVLALALRPFLARCVEVLQRVDFSEWRHGRCPYCGWEPDLAVITPGADRRLICGRCAGQWAFAPHTCPFCSNDDRGAITSFASRDGRYRVYGCDACRRYLKAYDERGAARPVMAAVDAIATLPLDAAAMQRGYAG
jgi:hypothetical protein